MHMLTRRYLRWVRELITRAEASKGERREGILKDANRYLDKALEHEGGEECASDDIKAAIVIERMQIEELREENDE